jgi:Xaa-Pro aminopeptidase
VRFNVGDPAACVEFIHDGKPPHRVFICRDIEMGRARQHARADAVTCPRDFEPAGGLSGDRETATAQAVAECLRRQHVGRVVSDRTLPLIYADHLRQAGIALEYDPQMGVLSRRSKDAQEVEWLHAAQRATEDAMRMACETVARAAPDRNGVLMHDGERLSAERLRFMIDVHLLRLGFANPPAIVACGPQAADCHEHGHGDLRTGQPVIVDIFPRCQKTLYNGDCTRTVVNGEPHPEVLVFPSLPDMKAFRADLDAAGIPYKVQGRGKIDFHALRKTFGTLLATAGVPRRVRQAAMRHADPRLTETIYLDEDLLPLFEHVAAAPAIVDLG